MPQIHRSTRRTLSTLSLAALTSACAPTNPYEKNPAITNHVEDWRDEVMYQLIVDRFANGERDNDYNVTRDPSDLARHHGGDWQGIIDEVDYLKGLGVTTIWISPVVLNVEEDAGVAGYHGYWTQDFEKTNPHFGDLARLRELVDVMHQNDIKVIVDIVANHVGQLFYYDINQNGQPDIQVWYATNGSDELDVVTEWDPAYDERGIQSFSSLGEAGEAPVEWVYMPEINRMPPQPPEFQNFDWYNRRGRVTDWNDLTQVELADFPGGLKDLATENPNVRRALIEVFSDWITKTNIDGYRIDTIKHVEHDFWVEFCSAIREHARGLGKENFLLFGEVFDGNDELVGSYTWEGMLDGVVDFPAKYQVFDNVFKNGGATQRIADLHAQRYANWGNAPQAGGVGVAPRDLPLSFLDNHDVGRFLWQEEDDSAIYPALAWLLLRDGVPILYYGTEQGFDGGNDPANRERLWDAGFDEDHPIYQWIADLNALRQEHEPLRRGTLEYLWTTENTGEEDDAGMLVVERRIDDEVVIVAINTHATKASRTVDESGSLVVDLPVGTSLEDVGPSDVTRSFSVSSEGALTIELGPRDVAVLVPR
ncbi:MAG TPA: alpha-amylase [Deltaproteobacteria bacterium]|nr:alpha-amylase [Deltaproteobacteria bacterium]